MILPPAICLLLVAVCVSVLSKSLARSVQETNIAVTVTFPDPAANLLIDSILVDIERAVAGTPGLQDNAFAVSRNQTTLVFFFAPDSDANLALSTVQRRVQTVKDRLPAQVEEAGVVVMPPMLNRMLFVTCDPSLERIRQSELYGGLYFKLLPEAKQIQGIASEMALGTSLVSIRVILNLEKIDQWNRNSGHSKLTAHAIVTRALTDSIIFPAWHPIPSSDPKAETTEYVTTLSATQARTKHFKHFEEWIVAATADGNILHVRDIGEVKVAELYPSYAGINPGIEKDHSPLVLQLKAGANRADVLRQIRDIIEQVKNESQFGDAKCDVSDRLPGSWRFSRHLSRTFRR